MALEITSRPMICNRKQLKKYGNALVLKRPFVMICSHSHQNPVCLDTRSHHSHLTAGTQLTVMLDLGEPLVSPRYDAAAILNSACACRFKRCYPQTNIESFSSVSTVARCHLDRPGCVTILVSMSVVAFPRPDTVPRVGLLAYHQYDNKKECLQEIILQTAGRDIKRF